MKDHYEAEYEAAWDAYEADPTPENKKLLAAARRAMNRAYDREDQMARDLAEREGTGLF